MLPVMPRLDGLSTNTSVRTSSSSSAMRVSGVAPSIRISRRIRPGCSIDEPSHPDVQHESEREHRPNEAPLLRQNREHEVGVLLRQELQLTLGPRQEPFAEQSARAYGDERLDELVPRSLRVPGRLEKRLDALLLVRLEVA